MKIKMLIIYCLHGDELVTEEIALELNRQDGIPIYLGNPAARAKKVRFIDTDLNRSFRLETASLESRRAKEIINELSDVALSRSGLSTSKYDLIIDLHTTKAKMPPCAIITSLDQLGLVSKIGIERVICMTEKFSSGGSLIENIPGSVSVEIFPDRKSIRFIKKSIKSAKLNRNLVNEFNVFFVEEIVRGEKDTSIVNFEQMGDGSYPVFAGETSYKDVKYLKTRMEVVKLS